MNAIQIFDTTLRDGEQAPGYAMNIDEKVRMALQLESLGVDVMEAGFAAASPGDFASVKAVADAVKTSSASASVSWNRAGKSGEGKDRASAASSTPDRAAIVTCMTRRTRKRTNAR